jgi:hypothetical protein
MNRCEFVGALLRLASLRYKETGECESLAASVEKLLTEDILNRSPIAQGIYSRQKHFTK